MRVGVEVRLFFMLVSCQLSLLHLRKMGYFSRRVVLLYNPSRSSRDVLSNMIEFKQVVTSPVCSTVPCTDQVYFIDFSCQKTWIQIDPYELYSNLLEWTHGLWDIRLVFIRP